MILDSNAVSDWWRGQPSLVALLQESNALYLPVPVLAEIRFGILKSQHRVRMEVWFQDAVRVTSVLVADAATAESYARIRHALETKGRKIPMNDLWIAAIALQHRLPVLSRDAHFDVVDDLERISW